MNSFLSAEEQKLNEVLMKTQTLSDFVQQKADEHGDTILAEWFDDDVRITYREFNNMIVRLSSALSKRGVRKGSHVAVMLRNRVEYPVIWITLARLGAVMIPINSAYKKNELLFVLQDSDSEFIFIDDQSISELMQIRESLPLISGARIFKVTSTASDDYSTFGELLSEGRDDFTPGYEVSGDDVISIQYTSGTTGFPKGCMLSQNYWLLLSGSISVRTLKHNQSIKNPLIWAPFSYMDPQWQFLLTMRLGGTAYVARRMSLRMFTKWLQDYPIHTCIFPEAALKQELSSEELSRIQLKSAAIFGWSIEGRKLIEERFKITARESYGMTEIGSALGVPVEAVDLARKRSVGVPSLFRELKIVDEEGNEVKKGEEGELLVRGRSIMYGYYKRADVNAKEFRDGWFCTGDMFRQDDDGNYYIVGRKKDMIRRAGENISALEVESILKGFGRISDIAVVPVPDPLRNEEVKAYIELQEPVTVREDLTPICQEIIDFANKNLSGFKVPRYFEFMTDEFARTPSRKIIKSKLIEDKDDLRLNSFDRVDNVWR